MADFPINQSGCGVVQQSSRKVAEAWRNYGARLPELSDHETPDAGRNCASHVWRSAPVRAVKGLAGLHKSIIRGRGKSGPEITRRRRAKGRDTCGTARTAPIRGRTFGLANGGGASEPTALRHSLSFPCFLVGCFCGRRAEVCISACSLISESGPGYGPLHAHQRLGLNRQVSYSLGARTNGAVSPWTDSIIIIRHCRVRGS